MKASLHPLWIAALCAVLFSGSAAPADTPQAPSTEGNVTHVEAAAAANLVAAKEVTVLDVRTPEEFRTSHIEGAKNLDFRSKDFAEQVAKLDKDKPYLVHCASGGRSTSSLEVFQKLGFTKIYHLDHGLNAWKKAGNPVTK